MPTEPRKQFPPPPLQVTVDDLVRDLKRARIELAAADIGIDNFDRRQREMDHWQTRIRELETQIARIEESF